MEFEFVHGPRIVSGEQTSGGIDGLLRDVGVSRPLIVTDSELTAGGMIDPLVRTLDDSGYDYAMFDEVESNPTTALVEDGRDTALEKGSDGIVAIGGGSTLDTGKALSVLVPNGGEWTEYEGTPDLTSDSLPLVAIPTTVGTGSEATSAAVITDADRDVKMTTTAEEMFPDIALLDRSLLESLPPEITARTGMDSLTQAIEAYLSPDANPITDALAIEATRMIGENLRLAVSTADTDAMANMQVATTMGGIAFQNAGLGLVHGMSEPVSGRFHTGHGVTNGILLPEVLEFNLCACRDEYARLAEATGTRVSDRTTRQSAGALVETVRELADDIGIPDGLSDIGADATAIPDLVEEAYDHVNSTNNPREYTKEDLGELYHRSF